MITQTAKYALKALIYLAEQNPEKYCQTEKIAEATKVPANYLGKTLQRLAHSRVLESQKGLRGGFRLGQPAAEITLYQILVGVGAIPRDFAEDEADDSSGLPSSVLAKFDEMTRVYMEFLKTNTLADVANLEKATVSAI